MERFFGEKLLPVDFAFLDSHRDANLEQTADYLSLSSRY
jgi:hypothetical protein